MNPLQTGYWRPDKPALTGASLQKLLQSPRVGPDCLVPEFLYRGKTTVLYGDPSIGKTTIILNLAVCLAGGFPVFDRLLVQPRRVYLMLFETEPEEAADNLQSISTRFPINYDNICIDTETIGMDCTKPEHAQAVINRVKEFKPDAVILDPLYMTVHGGLSKDEPCSAAVQFLRLLSHETHSGVLANHHGKKEQFERGHKIPGNYYGAIWIKAHARIMWEVREGPDDCRILTRQKDNLGVCRSEITLHYDSQSCTCTMKEEGDQTAKGRLLAHLGLLPPKTEMTTMEISRTVGISLRTLKNLFSDTDVLRLVSLERCLGRPTVWKVKPQAAKGDYAQPA